MVFQDAKCNENKEDREGKYGKEPDRIVASLAVKGREKDAGDRIVERGKKSQTEADVG